MVAELVRADGLDRGTLALVSNGAGGARTPGLRRATPALFQLSYSPEGRPVYRRELEVPSPDDRAALVIARLGHAQADQALTPGSLDGNEVAGVEVRAVRGEGVDLLGGVPARSKTLARAPARSAAQENDVTRPRSPLALHPEQPLTKVQDEVVARALAQGPVDVDPELGRRPGDGLLRDVPLLVGGEDRPKVPRELPWTPWLVRSCNVVTVS